MAAEFRAERCHGASRAEKRAISRAGGNNFPFGAEKDTPFPRRMGRQAVSGGFGGRIPRRTVPRSIPGGKGGDFLRRRQQFPIWRGKRYSIPAQNGEAGGSGRKRRPIPAQNGATEASALIEPQIPAQNGATPGTPGGKGRRFPEQAVTISWRECQY